MNSNPIFLKSSKLSPTLCPSVPALDLLSASVDSCRLCLQSGRSLSGQTHLIVPPGPLPGTSRTRTHRQTHAHSDTRAEARAGDVCAWGVCVWWVWEEIKDNTGDDTSVNTGSDTDINTRDCETLYEGSLTPPWLDTLDVAVVDYCFNPQNTVQHIRLRVS